MTSPEFKIEKKDVDVAELSDDRLTEMAALAVERNKFALADECIDEVTRRGLSIK